MCLFVGGGEGWFKYRATPSRLHTFVDCRIKWLGGYHALTTYLWCWSQQGRNLRNDGKHTFHVDDFDSHFTWTTIHAISWLTSSYISKYSLTTAQQAKSDVPIKLPMSFRAVMNSNLNPNIQIGHTSFQWHVRAWTRVPKPSSGYKNPSNKFDHCPASVGRDGPSLTS